jgi:anti-sigma B factor antagonist
MSENLIITVDNLEDIVKIHIKGEIDILSSQELKKKLYDLIDSVEVDIEVDFNELDYIDSTGLGIFIGALKRIKQKNRNIYIINLKDNIKKLFLITGLDKLFILK